MFKNRYRFPSDEMAWPCKAIFMKYHMKGGGLMGGSLCRWVNGGMDYRWSTNIRGYEGPMKMWSFIQ
jgi:hypothetical protein